MADYLSSSKRNFVERWKKSVDHYTTKGHLCKVTITDVPPERDGVISPCSERSVSRVGSLHCQGVRRRMVLSVNFFVFFRLILCFVVAMSDTVHDVKTIFHLL